MTGDSSTAPIGALLADLNHEIRTSMNGVAGMLALLLDTKLSGAQRQYAVHAQQGADRLMELIEQVMDVSLIETDQFRLGQTAFDLRAVALQACAAPQLAAQDKGLALHIDFPPALSVLGDPVRVQQIMHILLDGAVSASAHEPGPISAAIGAEYVDDKRCRLAMTVTAPLADHPAFALLNQPDRNARNALHAHGRLGLALALCRQIAQRMNAQLGIAAEDTADRTAARIRFLVELPRAAGVPVAPVGSARFAGRVLIADDNPLNQQVAQRMVEKFGCRADIAPDGQQALAMHEACPYDLILMDCQMPHVDGYQATERIRALDGTARRTPIIALTACTTQGEREKCLAKGMDDFISKPVRPQILEHALGRWLPSSPETAAPGPVAIGGDELDTVRDMFGADFAELARLYRNDGPPRIAALRKAHASADSAQLAKVAHAFGGSSVSIGATGLSALCKELELRAKCGALDDVGERLAAIEAEYGRISAKLQSMTLPDAKSG